MAEESIDPRELAYYQRQVDVLAGENLKLEYRISGLRHELKQKRQGFALLSQLQQSVSAHKQISSIFSVVLPAIGTTLGIDRAVVLSPGQREHWYRATQWIGFQQEAASRLKDAEIDFSAAAASELLLVNNATPPTPLIEAIRRTFELPFFVCVPVIVEQRTIALLIAGRLRESKPLYLPLDQGDVDTFVSIAGLISASIRNMRVGVLEEMDRLKTQFFANISHEFRTPITLTLGPLEQLLRGRYGAIGSEVDEQLRMMRRNQERLLTLVNQILDLAKLEAGEMRLRASRTADVNRAIGEVVGQFESAASDRHIALRRNLSPAANDADLYVDREKLERLLINLLSNALKFTHRGHIEVSTDVHDGTFRLTVRDTGIGIKEDQLPHVFDRFRQADGSESREYAGTGLGLALVKEIAELHGGSVTVNSRYADTDSTMTGGTTFRVTLPLGRAHLAPESIVEDAEPIERASSYDVVAEGAASSGEDAARANAETEAALDPARATLLYAEDNADLRRHVRELLRARYNVFLAIDGRDALVKMRRYRPDLVLSDQMMPTMSGRDLLAAIRRDEALRSTPVVFLTARAGTEARIESLEAGADDYLAKPFNEGELLARIENLLRARAQERELAELNRRLAARVEEQVGELLRNGELQRFVPRAVAERVLRGELSDAGRTERRKITVLSAGVTGFADATSNLEPEDLAGVTDEYLREMTAIAVENGGTVDRVDTDSLLVLFGAPQELSAADQAWSAATAAFAMRRRLRDLATRWRRRGIGMRLDLRAAVHAGYCTVGIFGSDTLRRFTAVGAPVTTAIALQEDAASGTIVCGATAHALIADRVVAEARSPRTLRGIARAVESHELIEAVSDGSEVLPRLRDFSFMPR